MLTNLIMWGSIIWIIPLVYFMQKNETKFKKNIVIGVTLPFEAREDTQVQEILLKFLKQLKILCIIMLISAVLCMPIRDFGVMMLVYLLWIDVFLVLTYIPYIRCNKALKELKIQRGWKKTQTETVANLELAGTSVKWLSPIWFLIPLVVSLIPLIGDRTFWMVYVMDAGLVLFSWLAYRFMYRKRVETVDENMKTAEVLTRIRQYNWGKNWLYTAWFSVALNWIIWLTIKNFWLNMTLIFLLTSVLVILVVRVEFRVRRMQEKFTKDSGKGFYVDEDDYWIWGMFYYNPYDKKLLINDRTGMNVSFNLARRAGKTIMFLLVLLLVSMPFMGVWLIYEERQPVELSYENGVLTASHTGTSYEIREEEIESAELLTEQIPLSKVNGSGMESVQKGLFNSNSLGSVKVCRDPRTGPWIFIQTEKRKYLLGSSIEGVAQRIYNQIAE